MANIPNANQYRSRNSNRGGSREGKKYGAPAHRQPIEHSVAGRLIGWIFAAGLVFLIWIINH